MGQGLVYVGKIIDLQAINGADFIVSATVVCGSGGKWRGVVRKDQAEIGTLCDVFLPDAQIPPNESIKFMESSGWRVGMRRFKGAPSEVLIIPIPNGFTEGRAVGDDMTEFFGVTKYHKPIAAHLSGLVKGDFPSFIPKTDEPNYQTHYDLVDALDGKPFYITEKCDGSSTTAYRYKGEFGVCSRNLEMHKDENNGYWKIAMKHRLEEKLPEGIALQWETCGPKIQSNPMGLEEIEGFAFSAYNIEEHRYLEYHEFYLLLHKLRFPECRVVDQGLCFDKGSVHTLGEGKYPNGSEREGVVVRSTENVGFAPISFKVINLGYET